MTNIVWHHSFDPSTQNTIRDYRGVKGRLELGPTHYLQPLNFAKFLLQSTKITYHLNNCLLNSCDGNCAI